MLYYIFKYLDEAYNLPGSGMFQYISFRAAASIILALLIVIIFGRKIIDFLRRKQIGEEVRDLGLEGQLQKRGTPTMGGIAFILGSGIVTFACGWQQMLAGDFAHLYVYLFALIFGLIGFVDDYRKVRQHQNEGLTAKQKFVLQLLAAVVFLCLMRYEGLLTNDLYIPFVNVTLTVNWIVYLIFAAFVIVGCVNSVNLTDGIDGLASSVTAVVMAFFMGTAMIWKFTTLGIFSSALCGSLLGFYALYNRHPAKCFMGDTGSLFLGGAVAALAFAFDMPLVLIPVGIIYILETLSDIIQVGYFKATHGKRFFKMAPLHHHLERCGWSEVKIVTVFVSITAVFCLLAYYGIRGRYL